MLDNTKGGVIVKPKAIPKKLTAFIYLYLRPHLGKFGILILITAIAGMIPPFETILLSYTLDSLTKATNASYETIKHIGFLLASLYAMWWFSVGILWRIYEYVYLQLFPTLESEIALSLFDHAEHHDQRYFQNNFSGSVANRITEMAENTCKILYISTEKLMRKFFTVFFTFITMYRIQPLIGGIFLTWIILLVAINLLLSPFINHYSEEHSQAKSGSVGKIVDSIANIINVKLFSRNDYENSYIGRALTKTKKSDQQFQFFLLKLRSIETILCTLFIGSMILLLSNLFYHHTISLGNIALVITLSVAVAEHIWLLTQEMGEFEKALGSCNQSLEVLAQPHDIIDSPHAKPLIVKQGKIEFRDVAFNHSDLHSLFGHLSITIKPRQKIGLVGFSGSGKTTFINLIIRLFDVESGKILIDDQDIATVTQQSLREQIGIIPQNPQLFHRSILENIRYGKPQATDEEVVEAAKQAFAHEFIMNSEGGYNTLAGERGLKLSGGQVQRIAIARAILKNAPILILDEATSALDSLTEQHLQQSFDYLMRNKTALVIAHRISTLLNMDRILVFSKGSIVEDGPHDQLLNQNGLYAKLWASQVNGFLSHDE